MTDSMRVILVCVLGYGEEGEVGLGYADAGYACTEEEEDGAEGTWC